MTTAAAGEASSKRLIRAIQGAPVDRPPFWLMRQAGRYLPEYRATRSKARNFVELCLTPDLATEITLQPIRRYGMDGAILFSDILLVPYALGQHLAFQEGEGPKLDPIRDRSGLTGLADSIDLDRLQPVYETIRLLCQALPSETTLLGFAGAPWTLATYVIEGGSSRKFEHVHHWTQTDPDGFTTLIDRLAASVAAHLIEQINAGAETVQIFDSWAAATDENAFEKWVLAPTRRIVDQVKSHHPNVPIIGFPKGIGTRFERYARESGVDMVSIDSDISLVHARDVLQPIAGVQGNLDPQILVEGGPALDDRVRAIVGALRHGRFIFNLGHGVVPPTPPEHVARVAELIKTI